MLLLLLLLLVLLLLLLLLPLLLLLLLLLPLLLLEANTETSVILPFLPARFRCNVGPSIEGRIFAFLHFLPKIVHRPGP